MGTSLRNGVRLLMVGLALLGGAAVAAPPAPKPAAEGTALIEALEAAPLGVVGTIEERSALDARGWRATVAVESALVGSAEPGQRVVIAWEELASARPPRFANGDRVLLALEPLVAGSLWRKRFRDPRQLPSVFGVAQRGAAFLRTPAPGSVSILQHYLLLPADLRSGPAGQRHLVALAADAQRPLALSAARRLAALTGGATLGGEDAQLVLRSLARADSDAELATSLLIWVERRQPVGLVLALDAALAAPAGAPATFVRARGLLGEGLPGERERALLASPSAAQRAAAASVASPAAATRLAELLRQDPAPEVRLAALRRLARLEGPAALETLLDAFDDADSAVRTDAALHVAAFGPEAVPRLQEAAGWPWPASQSAVLGLSHSNNEPSRAALAELAEKHPDQRVRTLAEIALGRSIGHRH
jgi:HEAT repeat protein